MNAPSQAPQYAQDAGDEFSGRSPRAVGVRDQVHRYLGVGVADQRDPARLQLGPQRSEVLDDAVVHDGDLPAGITMRVRVAVCRTSVRRPPRVSHPGGTDEAAFVHLIEFRFEA